MNSDLHQHAAAASSRGETSSQNEASALLATTEQLATTTSAAYGTAPQAIANVEEGELDGAKLVWWQHMLLAQAFSHTLGRAE